MKAKIQKLFERGDEGVMSHDDHSGEKLSRHQKMMAHLEKIRNQDFFERYPELREYVKKNHEDDDHGEQGAAHGHGDHHPKKVEKPKAKKPLGPPPMKPFQRFVRDLGIGEGVKMILPMLIAAFVGALLVFALTSPGSGGLSYQIGWSVGTVVLGGLFVLVLIGLA